MAWWGKGDQGDDADAEAASPETEVRRVVFEPEPLVGAAAKERKVKPDDTAALDVEWAIVARSAPAPAARRTPLQAQLAAILKKHKDGPIEDLAASIREALNASGREVPDDWILAIAEGLRRNGPTELYYDGPSRT